MIIATEAMIAELPKKDAPAMPPGGGGMTTDQGGARSWGQPGAEAARSPACSRAFFLRRPLDDPGFGGRRRRR